MDGKVKAIPDGYHAVTPYLIVDGAAAALEFYKHVFRATERMRLEQKGKIGHAEIVIGDSTVMLADEHPEVKARAPRSVGGTPVSIMVYVEDVDQLVARAVAAGAKLESPVQDKFYGDRMGTIEDPYGHIWHIATHKEDLTPEEIDRRAALVS